MKINSLYIEAFGKLKKFKIDFNDGFNVVYGGNENGKTTVMNFIKMMFYGSERSTASKLMNTRKKYTPWDSSQMAGSIDFEHQGKKYRLEKEFKGSNSTDKTTLCDLSLGERQAVSSDVGVSFFGLSLAAFERSVFIGGLGYPENDAGAEGEINSRLSNITSTGDQNVSFDAVNARLQKAKLTLMSKSGRAGAYDKNLAQIKELEEKLERSRLAAVEMRKHKAAITALEEASLKDAALAKELKAQIDAEQDIRNAQKLEQYLSLKAELDALNETLKLNDGSLLDEMYLSKVKFCISKLETAENKTKSKLSEIDTLKRSISAGLNPPEDADEETADRLKGEIAKAKTEKQALTEQIEDAQKETQNQKGGVNPLLFVVLTVVSAVAGIFLGVAANMILPAVAADVAAAVLLAVFVAGKTSQKKQLAQRDEGLKQIERSRQELSKIEKEIFDKTVKLETITAALNSSAAVIENQQKMLAELEEEIEALKTAEAQETAALVEVFSKYKNVDSTAEIIASIEELTEKSAKQKELKTSLSFIAKDLGSISYEEAKVKLTSLSGAKTSVDFAGLKAKYDELLNAISEKRSQIATLTAEAKAMMSRTENSDTIKKQLADLNEKAASQKKYCEALDAAMNVLLESFAEIRQSYGSALESKAAEIFSRLTGGKYAEMTVSKTFQIGVSEKDVFGNREIDFLSNGTADQAYLSLRLALSHLMCEGAEQLPILLDDALTQYDDTRATAALEFLGEYASTTQIIMFTCHKHIADKANANKIEL